MTQSSTRAARQHAFLALSCVGALTAPAAFAQTADDMSQKDAPALGGVTVTDTAITQEPGRRQESPKATRPLRDTPQTITVLTNEVIQQQNLLTLRDVLSTVPGITFGAGEGGGGYGDSITFRGYSANTDILIDGVRDSAQYTRTDPFNLEQLEVTNGANSVTNGAGSAGGSINIITKKPQAKDATTLSAGIGTDDYYRGTVDINKRVSDLVAVRLNAMVHRNDVPGRDVENYKRWGVAPSVTIGIDSPTKLTLQYVHQEDRNIPQYGVPYFITATNAGPVAGADRSSYYGYRNVDKQKTNLDQATATFSHDFSDTVSIRNLTRWQDVTQFSLVDPPQGTYCVNGQTVAAAPAACAYSGYYQPSGPRGTTRKTRNQLAYDQVDLNAVFSTGFIEHTIDFGGALTWEKFHLSSGNSLRNADGTAVYTTYPLINIANPNAVVAGPASSLVYGSNVYTGPVNFIPTATQTGETTNYAVYLFDTMKLLPQLELSGGVRYEHNSGSYRADTISAVPATLGAVTPGTRVYNRDDLFSYRVGLNFKPIEAVSLYVAYGNSKTPSKSSVNGSCTIAGVNGATASTCNVKPEGAKNYEIGAKAELFHGGLLLTAALFRNERDSYRVASNDPTVPDQQLDGHSRVDGLSLGATGRITPAWSITANYTYLKSKLIQSVSNYCLANPSTACGNSAANPDPGRDTLLTQTPEHSGSLFTNYKLPFGLTLGYGLTYQGSFPLNVPTLTSRTVLHSDDFLIHNAMLVYDITDALQVQVNVKNFTDKLYYTRIRNNGWATPGDGRSAILTVNYKL